MVCTKKSVHWAEQWTIIHYINQTNRSLSFLLLQLISFQRFFPLNRMSFTGMEIYLAFFFFVFLLGSQLLRSFFLSYAASVRVLAYSVGLLSFIPYDLKNPLFPFTFFNHKGLSAALVCFPYFVFSDPNAGRMPMVSFSVILGLFAIFRLWWSSNAERRYRSLWGFLLGYVVVTTPLAVLMVFDRLVVMMCVRLEYLTLNPVTVWTKPIFVNIIAVIWAGYTLGAEVRIHLCLVIANIFTMYTEVASRRTTTRIITNKLFFNLDRCISWRSHVPYIDVVQFAWHNAKAP